MTALAVESICQHIGDRVMWFWDDTAEQERLFNFYLWMASLSGGGNFVSHGDATYYRDSR